MEEAMAVRADDEPGSCRILLVDDSEEIVDVVSEVLELAGYQVRTAHDGASAIDVAAELRPQLAVLDLGLPVISGYELARELRARYGDDIMLVSLSGRGGADVDRQSRDAGFDRHLTKPASVWQLRGLATEAVRARGGSPDDAAK
jgi:CheY-like chemotaxis protein